VSVLSIFIREIRREDIRDIIEIIERSKLDFIGGFYLEVYRLDEEEVWKHFRGSRKFPTFVAVYDNKVIGVGINYPHWDEEDNYYIELLVTHPDYRRLGAGKNLIKRCLDVAITKGFKVLSLYTWATNRAMHLYHRTGFCWIPSSWVYMINFSPQLLQYEELKKLFKNNTDLIDRLEGIPKKVEINGHIVWEYSWRVDGKRLKAQFNNDTKRLFYLAIDADVIKINPPQREKILKDEEIEFMVEVTKPRVLLIDNKTIQLTLGSNKVKTKAKNKVKFKIDGLEFGFGLEVVDPIEIRTQPERCIQDSPLRLMLINNTENKIDENLFIRATEGIKVLEKAIPISLKPKSTIEKRIFINGEGKIFLKIKDCKKEIPVFGPRFVNTTEDCIESSLWKVTKDQITVYFEKPIYIYYDIRLKDEYYRLKSSKQGSFYYDGELSGVEVKPKISHNILEFEIEIQAKKEVNGTLDIDFWISRDLLKRQFILPLSDGELLRGNIIYPVLPKTFELIRIKLPEPWVGIGEGSKLLKIKFSEDASYTLESNSLSFKLTFPVEMRLGDIVTKKISFTIEDLYLFLHKREAHDFIDIKTSEDKILLKNYWLNPIELSMSSNGIDFKKTLKPGEESIIKHNKTGFGLLNVDMNIRGVHKELKIPFINPLKINWQGKSISFGGLKISTTHISGGIQSLKFDNIELLDWYGEIRNTPIRLARSYGGIALGLFESEKDLEIHLKEWKKINENEYSIMVKNIKIIRRWDILDEESFIERVIVENRDYKPRKLSFVYSAFLNDKLPAVSKLGWKRKNYPVLGAHDKKFVSFKIHDKQFGVLLRASKDQFISATQVIGFNGIIRAQWTYDLLPKEKKEGYVIWSQNLEKFKKILAILQ